MTENGSTQTRSRVRNFDSPALLNKRKSVMQPVIVAMLPLSDGDETELSNEKTWQDMAINLGLCLGFLAFSKES